MNPVMIQEYLKTQKKNYVITPDEGPTQAQADTAAAGVVAD